MRLTNRILVGLIVLAVIRLTTLLGPTVVNQTQDEDSWFQKISNSLNTKLYREYRELWKQIYLTNDDHTYVTSPEFRKSSACLPFGINLICKIHNYVGMSESARGLALSLIAARVPLQISSHSVPVNASDEYPFQQELDHYVSLNTTYLPYYFNLVVDSPVFLRNWSGNFIGKTVNFDPTIKGGISRNISDPNHQHNSALLWWELEHTPESRFEISGLDEILAVTDFIAKSFRKLSERVFMNQSLQLFGKIPSEIPVFRIGCISLPELFTNKYQNVDRNEFRRDELGISEGHYVFMYSWDDYSVRGRKNPEGVVSAFARAFKSPLECDKAVLLMKSIHATNFTDVVSKIKPCGRVIQINRQVSEQYMHSLYVSADCYVSLHRAEGFGNGIAHVMGLGKPVIVTNYSGVTDFVTDDVGYPVSWHYQKVGISTTGNSFFDPNQIWANPDLNHAAKLMRHVLYNQKEALEKGKKASQLIKHRYSPKNCGKLFLNHFLDLYYKNCL